MLILGLIISVVSTSIVKINFLTAKSILNNRNAVMVFVLCLILTNTRALEVELYHSVFVSSSFTLYIDFLLFVVSALMLVCLNFLTIKIEPEYGLILMFSVLGATMIISSLDLISIYIALELQSFSIYLLSCLRIDRTSSTSASLKYFLLGAISSAFILLGISLVYQELGTINFLKIYSFLDTYLGAHSESSLIVLNLGILSILCGSMFKISAAPFHSWFSDVIQGVSTYTSIIIINLPKISIFVFLFNFLGTVQVLDLWSSRILIIIATVFSLVLGTVAGLVQTKIKRLLAFSTISHVGFLLISLICIEAESSLKAFLFYITQYTLVTILAFLCLIAYENYKCSIKTSNENTEVNYIVDLQQVNFLRLVTFTFVLCLFSIAGIPPITGFYAKLEMLNSSMIYLYPFIFITAIICSVISAAYYLKVIKVIMFDQRTETQNTGSQTLTNVENSLVLSSAHSYSIAVLTAFATLFILDPRLIINCTELVALSVYVT